MVAAMTSSFHSWLDDMVGNPTELAYVPNIFVPSSQRMSFKERVINVLISHWLFVQIHYYTNSQLQYVKKNFGMELSHITDLYRDVSLYLVNSHYSLNGIRPLATNVIEVGGLHLRDDGPLLPVRSKEN